MGQEKLKINEQLSESIALTTQELAARINEVSSIPPALLASQQFAYDMTKSLRNIQATIANQMTANVPNIQAKLAIDVPQLRLNSFHATQELVNQLYQTFEFQQLLSKLNKALDNNSLFDVVDVRPLLNDDIVDDFNATEHTALPQTPETQEAIEKISHDSKVTRYFKETFPKLSSWTKEDIALFIIYQILPTLILELIFRQFDK